MLITSGYEHWAKIHNLKQAARTLNFLTENRIGSYAELSAKIAEVNAASEQAADALKGVERRLADMAVLIKNVTTYQKKKPVYDAYRRAKDKAACSRSHCRDCHPWKGGSKLPLSPPFHSLICCFGCTQSCFL